MSEMATLMLCIEGLEKDCLRNRLSPMQRLQLLALVYKDELKGGVIKSSYEEEWSYTADGVLKSTVGVVLIRRSRPLPIRK